MMLRVLNEYFTKKTGSLLLSPMSRVFQVTNKPIRLFLMAITSLQYYNYFCKRTGWHLDYDWDDYEMGIFVEGN